ncbi:RND efflux system, outer membrane lipoprotein, NodT family [Myroides odoratimimus]|uniref:NodT family efflux transporter, outer membrane factor (OMF) lipoprotein n=1 Tax=Myroides odoratimimus CCUG 10230 TaxID=883150 RepID=A0ABP2NG29_9FLAO|nr:efflux transporter outer membrane subunit [Myroides odoratimimus]EHO12930.1 NodT family efflux transporter, outer membrane factor (OMF) lipoprotein [Myroides odoratimimus CCUG 10230]MDM1519327.1 efflux transporter outer membrane subunit [Myroides odoratimimus]SHM44231.1 efflux transporter, outer membrane factor (OMF) lipoprotein, NodT family [Myroides odoratimimus subsp. xuanwuensis]STZ47827.1 Outer membrane protein oprM precursor [Myroides odoratimimus]GAQ15627.1 RND efflux system, outer m
MNTKRIITSTLYVSVVSAALALHSCAPQSNYKAPEFELPEQYRGQLDSINNTRDSVGIADIDWKTFFEDEKLIELINSGLEHNFDMANAIKNIEIADQKARQAKLEWLPSVDMTLGNVAYQYRSSNYYGSAASKYYENKGKDAPENMYVNSAQYVSSLGISWELDVWGKMKSMSAEALANYLQTHEARKAVQTTLIANIAEGYYNLLLLDAQMEVAQSNYELTKNTLKIVELQRDAGQTTSLAIQQTRNQMLVAKALIPSLKQQIAVQENALSLLTGQLPDAIERDTKLAEVNYQETLTTGVPLYLVSQRPDVQQAELALKASNARVGVAQTSRYPSLTIDVTGGLNSMLGKNWFNIPGSLFGGLIGDVAAPLFNKRKLKTDYEVAKIEREKAEIDLQKSVYTAITEVSDALITLETVKEQIEIAEEQVATSRLGVKQSNLLFNSGYANYIEIINAQKNMLDSELNLNKLKQNKLISRVKLYQALGGGWK